MHDLRETKVAVSLGKATRTCLSFDVSEDVLMSFCLAGVALCDI